MRFTIQNIALPAVVSVIRNIPTLYHLIVYVYTHTAQEEKVISLPKDLQPHIEHPSKDRCRIFAAGDIPVNVTTPAHHDLLEFNYWAVLQMVKHVKVHACSGGVYL